VPIAILRPPRLVGRDVQWARLAEGHAGGRVMLVRGEPGIGKRGSSATTLPRSPMRSSRMRGPATRVSRTRYSRRSCARVRLASGKPPTAGQGASLRVWCPSSERRVQACSMRRRCSEPCPTPWRNGPMRD
jgi:hypothetical protein